jgi:hypothetical protein
MNIFKPMFVRGVARIDDLRFVSGQVAGPVRTPFDRRRNLPVEPIEILGHR